jgi:hypothetical protein
MQLTSRTRNTATTCAGKRARILQHLPSTLGIVYGQDMEAACSLILLSVDDRTLKDVEQVRHAPHTSQSLHHFVVCCVAPQIVKDIGPKLNVDTAIMRALCMGEVASSLLEIQDAVAPMGRRLALHLM